MALIRKATRANPRLRASPNFVLSLALDGRAFVAQDTEPFIQYWLSDRYRVLLSLFSARRGLRVDEALAAWHHLQGSEPGGAEDRRLMRAIDDMRKAGVLMASTEDTSRYDRGIVEDYLAHRPFPEALTEHLVRAGGIGRTTRVLDLAGGPGDLALQLAAVSDGVAMMDLSRGFVAAAADRAQARGRKLQTLHDSANRLAQRSETWDAIVVAQALHWLDDVQVCRGVCHALAEGGSFFVVHAAMELPDEHPLAYLLGHDSILGAKERKPFAAEVQPLLRRVALLLQALDARGVEHVDLRHAQSPQGEPIGVAGAALFAQQRPFDLGYARGFLTPRHIERSGLSEDAFWRDLQGRCAAARPEQFLGTHRWAVLHFKRGVPQGALPLLADARETAIGFVPREPARA
jgi:2-polyprenyl-3-methyl-5-hydroxy-6-metoxy-1,4-benzoquinol methylase